MLQHNKVFWKPKILQFYTPLINKYHIIFLKIASIGSRH